MKKLFLLLPALVLSLAANAQKLEFRLNGESLQDGATATIPAEIDEYTGEVVFSTNPNDNLKLLVIHQEEDDDFTEDATCIMEVEENTVKASPSLCIGGSCINPKPGQTTITQNFTFTDYVTGYSVNDVRLDYHAFYPQNYGHLLSKCTVKAGAASSYIYIDFVYSDPAGIKDVNKSDNTAEVGRYTADGQQISAPVKGLNIVKLANGKTIKQVVK